MSTLLATFIALLSLTSALPATTSPDTSASYNGTTYPLGTKLSFKQTSYPYTNNAYLSAAIYPVGTEPGACYPHVVSTTYIAPTQDSLLNFTTTGKTKSNGRTPVNNIDEAGDCWALTIESGILTVRQAGGTSKGFYVKDGVLMNDEAPNGFYYCYDTNGNGIVGVEDKKMTHAGGIYSICFTTTFTAYETGSE